MKTRASALRLFRRRATLLLFAVLAANGAVAIVACSTNSPEGEPPAKDGSAPDRDSEASAPDAGKDSAIPLEAGRDAGGRCSTAKGPCDVVLQDCPADASGSRQECVVNEAHTTECRLVQASQQLPKGRACCPNSAGGNPCLPGLTCVGTACADGGPVTGRCSPACCEGDDRACGRSAPEGISGACDLLLVDAVDDAPLHHVCTYRERCKPFGVEPCRPGRICLMEDDIGTSSCVDSFGKTNREPCSFANECADGYLCASAGDAGLCRTICLLPDASSPFDAAIAEAGPGAGGCPVNEVCRFSFTNSPAWFGACGYPDGG